MSTIKVTSISYFVPGRIILALVAAAALAGATPNAFGQANILSVGDVSPADRPFIPGEQGVPVGGSVIFTESVDFDGNPIDGFGARFNDEDGNLVGQFNYERSANIEVGRYQTGQMLMSGGAVLRFGDLVIGGDTGENTQANNLDFDTAGFLQAAGAGTIPTGSGTVEIAGNGTLFNNHPLIVDPQFQDLSDPEATSFDIPTTYNPDFDLGGIDGAQDTITDIARPDTKSVIGGMNSGNGEFDLYVGLQSSGVLRIVEGGRAEIRDGAFVGVGPGATGLITVDGSGSYLGVYGMKNPFTGGGGAATDGQTLLGVYGDGTLEITNGGRVDSFNRAALGAIDAAGDNGQAFERGGHGSAIVDGQGSVWRIFTASGSSDDDLGSGLAIGEYFEDGTQETRIDMLLTGTGGSGNEAYREDDGRGTLTIRNGGLVSVREDQLNNNQEDASVRIGRYGVLQMTGGRMVVGTRLDNDGLIRTGDSLGGVDRYGDGDITTGTFLNSPLGEIRVRGSEHLTIRSINDSGDPETLTAGSSASVSYFHGNSGKIDVLGDQALGKATIEFDRELDTAQNGSANDDRFRNFEFLDVPTGDTMAMMMSTTDVRGQITAQEANLYFRSGLLNEADVNFVGGDNVVSGPIENAATGVITIVNESHVAFQDEVVNAGVVLLNDESDVAFLDSFTVLPGGALIDLNPAAITVGSDFTTAGSMEFVIGGGLNGLDFTRLGVAGDATFEDTATIAIDDLSLTGVVEGSSYDLITVSGTVTDNGLATVSLPTAPAGLAFVPRVFDPLFDAQKYILDVVAISAAVVGADFNGDGFVDGDDVAIWLMFNGLQSGATGLLGDADGDGDVDAADGFILNAQLGGAPVPVPVIAGAAISNAPEPATAGLLALALAAGCCPRRRNA
ncbi:MAG: hypothetical protein AAF589_03225 [Planctomycetota bacterium]